ncbi:BlaI/MecI/CopY family transcriptional regulator [Nocardioides pakistanensis]
MALTSRMGELERAVMDELWSVPDGGWLTVREVHDRLASRRAVAYTTVMTVMDRLSKKSLVRQQRDGRAYRYAAAASRAAMTADLMRGALEEYAVDERDTALVAFVGEASAEERAALRRALAELEDD